MSKQTKIDIIADNGGGITLQYHGRQKYLHTYNNGEQVITDLRAIINDDFNPEDGWDGNEYPDIKFGEYDCDMERNGGYKWYSGTASQLIARFRGMDHDDCWYNVKEMIIATQKL